MSGMTRTERDSLDRMLFGLGDQTFCLAVLIPSGRRGEVSLSVSVSGGGLVNWRALVVDLVVGAEDAIGRRPAPPLGPAMLPDTDSRGRKRQVSLKIPK